MTPTSAGRLAGKTAVITGGSSGIGLTAARLFRDEGAAVLITGSRRATVDAALADLGDDVRGVPADMRDVTSLDRVAEAARDAFGGIDILFANAGSGVFAPVEAVDEAAYDTQFDITVKGVFFTVQKLKPLLRAGASVILTASAVNQKGAPAGSLYFATKAAVRSFARSLAAEFGPLGFRVNSLSPGIVRTGFQAKTNLSEDQMEGFVQMVVSQAPLGREGSMLDMARAALFLASDESAYMTAADLVVDGGWMNV